MPGLFEHSDVYMRRFTVARVSCVVALTHARFSLAPNPYKAPVAIARSLVLGQDIVGDKRRNPRVEGGGFFMAGWHYTSPAALLLAVPLYHLRRPPTFVT